jgi:hypothetical protein
VATIHAILAMSYHQLGQPENARAELAQSHEIIENKLLNGLDVGGQGNQGFWFDWVLGNILLREATALIGGAQPNTTGYQPVERQAAADSSAAVILPSPTAGETLSTPRRIHRSAAGRASAAATSPSTV